MTEPKKTPKRKPNPQPNEGGPPARGGAPVVLDHIKFALICEELARTGSKYKSCEALGFDYSTVVTTVKRMEDAGDDSWRELWDDSYNQFRDSLEQAAIQRGRDGTPVEFKINPATGERVPTKIEYSDRLMEVLLKGHFPERFRDRVHHSGTVGLEPVDAFANLTTKAKREIRAIIMRDLEEQRVERAERDAAIEVDFREVSAVEIEDMRADGEREETDDV